MTTPSREQLYLVLLSLQLSVFPPGERVQDVTKNLELLSCFPYETFNKRVYLLELDNLVTNKPEQGWALSEMLSRNNFTSDKTETLCGWWEGRDRHCMSYHVAIAIQYISQAAGIRRSNPRLGNGNYEISSSPHTAASSSLGEECVISQYLRRDRMEQLSEEGERESWI